MVTVKRQSRKRDAILEAVRSTDIHPTAEWVYDAIKPAFPQISLATVYRNLNSMKEDGIITSVAVVDGKERFERCTEPHVHFICSQCSGVYDIIGISAGVSSYEDVEKLTGARVMSHSLIYTGVCEKCAD